MEYQILHKPSYAMALIDLDEGEEIQAETGCMVSMSENIKMKTQIRGGLLGGFKRRNFGGESFFINSFSAEKGHGELAIAPQMSGDVEAMSILEEEPVILQRGSFLAASEGITIDSTWGGIKSVLNKEGLFMLKCEGEGTLFISSYGAVHRVDLDPGERYTVDNGHMVAFGESIRYNIGKVGGWKTTLLGGEGLVCKLEGPGTFYMQTRSEEDHIQWLMERLPRGKRKG